MFIEDPSKPLSFSFLQIGKKPLRYLSEVLRNKLVLNDGKYFPGHTSVSFPFGAAIASNEVFNVLLPAHTANCVCLDFLVR